MVRGTYPLKSNQLCQLRCSKQRPFDLVDDFSDSRAYRDECGGEGDEDPLPRLVEYRLSFYQAYLGYHRVFHFR